MRWRRLGEFRDAGIGKLNRLRLARRAGLHVPETFWARADAVAELHEGEALAPPPALSPPWIVRSAAPDEDTGGSTAAGRYESVEVIDPADFPAAVRRVVDSMRSAKGGGAAVFVQPLLAAEAGGIAFFDGFFFERTEAPGGNRALTAGEERGSVVRGDLTRGEAWSEWLQRVGRAFAQELRGDARDGAALDIEYVREGERYMLLQARPARFAVRRNPVLSLANHREILGDHPSPWIVDALVRAGGGALEEFARIDPVVGRWNGQYAEECAGRAWLSFSFFFRLMDHWGLPRTFVTEGVGGDAGGPLDGRARLGRMVRKSPRLVRLQLQNRRTIGRISRALAGFDERLDEARSLQDWFEATVYGLDLALRTNFAINGAWTGVYRVRRFLGVRGRARVVTEEMMAAYEDLARLPESERAAGLDEWLTRFGHRGPLESDPMQPRFRELRDVLAADLLGRPAEAPDSGVVDSPSSVARTGLFFRIDETRERFRDDLMVRWEKLRSGILAAAHRAVEAGELRAAEDVFLLDGKSLAGVEGWPAAVEAARARREAEGRFDPPLTARRDEIEESLRRAAQGSATADSASALASGGELRGIGVGEGVVRGQVRRARDLASFLRWLGERSPDAPPVILLVPALEPSWSVAFGRVAGAITEIGGELSHASILLRESRTPAVVNCREAYAHLGDGDEVELDAHAGIVRRVG